jgi:hypothetical protein
MSQQQAAQPGVRTAQDSPAAEKRASLFSRERIWPLLFFIAVDVVIVLLIARPVIIRLSYLGDHYVFLAQHLAHFDLTVDSLPSVYQDHVEWNGHKYLPLGPLPGVLLIPFLPFMEPGQVRDMVWVGYLFTLLNVWLFWRVLGLLGVRGEKRNWSLLLFFGGTIYLAGAAVGTSWFFAHIVVTTFLLAAIGEMLGKRRLWLVGLFLGLAGLTRTTALFSLPFFLWLLWRGRDEPAAAQRAEQGAGLPWRQAGLLAAGLAVPVALLFAYNYARFGSVLESGYGHAVLIDPVLQAALSQGLFSVAHIPKNLFMMLLQGPLPYPGENAPVLQFPYVQPSQWGMGLFFTTPAFVYSFRAGLRRPLVQACWLGIVSVAVPLVLYYGVGWVQFGFRYALDFIPFLILLTVLGVPEPMTKAARVLVLVSVAINVWGAVWLAGWS